MSWEIGLMIAVLAVGFMTFKMTRGAFSPVISQEELLGKLKQSDVVVLDVRSNQEYRNGHIPGALNIEVQRLGASLDELASHRDKTLVVTCEHGLRARMAMYTLQRAGFEKILHLSGDMQAWRKAQFEMETE